MEIFLFLSDTELYHKTAIYFKIIQQRLDDRANCKMAMIVQWERWVYDLIYSSFNFSVELKCSLKNFKKRLYFLSAVF